MFGCFIIQHPFGSYFELCFPAVASSSSSVSPSTHQWQFKFWTISSFPEPSFLHHSPCGSLLSTCFEQIKPNNHCYTTALQSGKFFDSHHFQNYNMLMIGLLAMIIVNFELVKMVACAERNLVFKFDVHFCFCMILGC